MDDEGTQQLMEILDNINKLSGAGLEFLAQKMTGGGSGGGAAAEGAPASPEQGAPVPPGQ